MGLEGKDGLRDDQPQTSTGIWQPLLWGAARVSEPTRVHLHWSRMVMAEVMGIMWFQIQQVFTPEFNSLQINEKKWLQIKDPEEVSSPVFLVPLWSCSGSGFQRVKVTHAPLTRYAGRNDSSQPLIGGVCSALSRSGFDENI